MGLSALSGGCDSSERSPKTDRAPSRADAQLLNERLAGQDSTMGPRRESTGPRELYLPTGGGPGNFEEVTELTPRAEAPRACPMEMVLVMGRYCIDRYEVILDDARSGFSLSPHYPPTPLAAALHADWVKKAPSSTGTLGLLPVPEAPSLELLKTMRPRALSKEGVLPQGYLSKVEAARACSNAGKRLCTLDEWVTACQGEAHNQYPYGPSYEASQCNVHRASHAAALLHRDVSRNHLDPRLGLTYDSEGPLLRRTGSTPSCKSTWGADAAFDMVGNLDEWVDTEGATFVGGFFSRATREGCLSQITSHRADYMDYSLGTRCCQGTLSPGSVDLDKTR